MPLKAGVYAVMTLSARECVIKPSEHFKGGFSVFMRMIIRLQIGTHQVDWWMCDNILLVCLGHQISGAELRHATMLEF